MEKLLLPNDLLIPLSVQKILIVQNIYYMLSYAFQALQAQNYKDLATEKFHNTAELCAAILDKGISVQLKRGLGRDYVPKSESLSTLQGKLDV